MIVIHMISLDICVSISISIIYLYISRCGRSSAFLLKNCAKPEALKHRGDRWVADTGLQLPLQGTHHWEGNGPKPGLQTGKTSSFVIWKLRSNIKTFLNCHGWMDGHNGYNGYNGWTDPFPHIFQIPHTHRYIHIYISFLCGIHHGIDFPSGQMAFFWGRRGYPGLPQLFVQSAESCRLPDRQAERHGESHQCGARHRSLGRSQENWEDVTQTKWGGLSGLINESWAIKYGGKNMKVGERPIMI